MTYRQNVIRNILFNVDAALSSNKLYMMTTLTPQHATTSDDH